MRWNTGTTILLILFLQKQYAVAAADTPVTAEFRADILRLMNITGAKAMGQQMGEAVVKQTIEAIRKVRPDLPEKALRIVNEVATEHLKDSTLSDQLFNRLIPIYAKYFSHDDIKAMLAFYDTPIGRKTIEVMPRLLADSMQAGQEWAVANQAQLDQHLKERLKAEGFLE